MTLPQVGGSLCDSLQSSGQRGQTLGLSWWTKSATGSSTGSYRPEIPENTCPDYTQVRHKNNLSKSGVQSNLTLTSLAFCRWHVQRGVVCIPKSVTPSRIQQNLQVFDFSLSEDDMKLMESFNRGERFIVPTVEVSHWSYDSSQDFNRMSHSEPI